MASMKNSDYKDTTKTKSNLIAITSSKNLKFLSKSLIVQENY